MNPIASPLNPHARRQGRVASGTRQPRAVAAPTATPQDPAPALHHSGTLLTQALAAAHSAPDVRQERVAALKRLVASDSYHIDPEALTDSLLRDNPRLFSPL